MSDTPIYNNHGFEIYADRYCSKGNGHITADMIDVIKVIDYKDHVVIKTDDYYVCYNKKTGMLRTRSSITALIEYDWLLFIFYDFNYGDYVATIFMSGTKNIYKDFDLKPISFPVKTADDFQYFLGTIGMTYNKRLVDYGTVIYEKYKKPYEIIEAYNDVVIRLYTD